MKASSGIQPHFSIAHFFFGGFFDCMGSLPPLSAAANSLPTFFGMPIVDLPALVANMALRCFWLTGGMLLPFPHNFGSKETFWPGIEDKHYRLALSKVIGDARGP